VVSIVSGGDAGVYGMASIVLEVVDHAELQIPVEVIPGVTAATAAASRLGSPLSSDFAVISLSDLLTPWEVIERRLNAAFSVQIPVVLYNPKSKTRKSNLRTALLIAGEYLSPHTPVGVVKDAFREGEQVKVSSLQDLIEELEALKVRSPEKLSDTSFMKELYERYSFYYTDFGGLS
jgi:precorrin-3B C17-methyltransferase